MPRLNPVAEFLTFSAYPDVDLAKSMKNILVIEDDDHFRFLVCKFLRKNNFHVIEAENPVVGMQLSQEQYPDLIICDLDLPDQNDYHILKKLQEDSRTGKIPLIFLIGKADEYHRVQARELGANIWLKKPIDFSKLLLAIVINLNPFMEKYGDF